MQYNSPREVLIIDYLEDSYRRFRLDCDTLKIEESYLKKEESWDDFCRFAAGYGAMIRLVTGRKIFTAIFVYDRALNLLLDTCVYKLDSNFTCTTGGWLPFVKLFTLSSNEKSVCSFHYLSFGEDYDFLLYILDYVNDPDSAKAFAYIHSAGAVGRHRLPLRLELTKDRQD